MIYDLADVSPANARDVLAAAPDGIALALGTRLVKNDMHPFALLVAESPLRFSAYAAGQILSPSRGDEPQAAVIGRGLRTLEFGRAIAAGIEAAARLRFNAQAQHGDAVAVVEVTRLGVAEPVGALDLSVPFENVADGIEYTTSTGALSDGESITLTSLGRLVGLTREAVYNDDLGLVEDAISATGVAAARHEARLVAATLEANGNLTDGSPVFDAAFGNVVADAFQTAGSADGLAAAIAALRNMPAADGFALDAQAATIFVAPDLELVAHSVLAQFRAGQLIVRDSASFYSGEALPPLRIVVLAGLPAGRYYVSASPSVARTVALARLAGQAHPLAVEAVRTPLNFDGQLLRVRIDTGTSVIGRFGIVKGGA